MFFNFKHITRVCLAATWLCVPSLAFESQLPNIPSRIGITDLTGTWLLTVETPAGATLPIVEFIERDGSLSGTYLSSTSGLPLAIVGRVGKDSLHFQFDSDRIAAKSVVYRARMISSDSIRGTVTMAHREINFFGVRR